MSGADFDTTWLSLREPVDHRARAKSLALRFLGARTGDGPIADLGAGTGSNARYLKALSPVPLPWRLIDADAGLLSRAGCIGAGVEAAVMNLARISPQALDGVSGVTAAAFLDLVSKDWLRELAELCARKRVPALFALTVDGVVHFDPEDPDDESVLAGFAGDQDRDKGFGPALGPAAADCAERLFAGLGFSVERAHSDWVLSADDGDLLRTYLKGVAAAAVSVENHGVEAWLRRRIASAAGHRLTVTVGHADVLAVPSRK